LLTALNLANTCDLNYKNSKNQRLQVELALIKMCHIRSVVNLAQQPLSPSNTATDVDQDKKKTNVVAGQAETPKPKAESENTVQAVAPIVKTAVSPNIPAEEKPKETPRVGPPPSATSISINIPKSNAISTLIPSLNDLNRVAQEDDDKGPKKVTGEAREPFSYDRLLEVWNAFTQKMKAADKINLFTILNNFAPTLLNPELIEISVESKTQEHLVQQESVELLNFLRNELSNFGVEVTYKLVERKIENRLYGNREKYDYLVNKNPKLDELRRRFNLDVNP